MESLLSTLMIKLLFYIFFIFIFDYKLLSAEGYIKAMDGIQWDSENNTYTAIGNVNFKNNKIKAISDKLIAKYIEVDQKEIFTVVEFFKDIVIYFEEEIFKSDYAIYTKDNNTIKLIGNVSIESPNRLLKGDELIVELDDNKRTLNSNSSNSIVEVLIENNASN